MKYFIRIIKYIKPYLGLTILNLVFNFFSIVFSLFSLTLIIPFLGILFETQEKVYNPRPLSLNSESIKENFYALISKIIDENGQLEALLFICLLVLITFFLKNLFRYLALFFLTPIRNGVVHNIRTDIHKKIISLPISYFTEKRKGDIISRMTADLIEVEWSIMSSLEMIFKDPLTILIYLSTLIIISPKLTVFVIVLFPITGFLIALIGKSLKKSSQIGQKEMGNILSNIDEHINGLRIIKSLNAENSVHKKFIENSNFYKSNMNSLIRKMQLSSPLSEFLSTIVLVIVMWFGGQLVLDNNSSISAQEFIGYILIFSQIIPPAKSFTSSYYNIQKGAASAERIYSIIDTVSDLDTKNSTKKVSKFNTSIHFKKVSFSYEEQIILKNLSLKIKKGSKTAIVGHSGSGKSSLVNLLPRFYDVNAGSVLIDDINIKKIKLTDLRDLVGIVNQDTILFNDTILNNIKIGSESSSHEEIISAAKIANAHDFIMKTTNQYESKIGEKGDKLSGGQKQRISIARAILKNPPILILDEATSSLDSKSEKLVQEALNGLMKNRTSIIIAHRLSTIKDADQILVINNGELVERGSHEELLELDGQYKKLYDLQTFS